MDSGFVVELEGIAVAFLGDYDCQFGLEVRYESRLWILTGGQVMSCNVHSVPAALFNESTLAGSSYSNYGDYNVIFAAATG